MRRAWWLGGGAVVLVVAAFGAVKVAGPGGDADKAKAPDPALEFTPREVVKPTLAGLPLTLEFSGALVAPRTAVLRAKTAGTLVELAVGEGNRVRAGQVLGRIDLSDIDSRVAERAATVESARAQFVQAERVHASNQRLADQQFISPNALDASRAALDAARAGLEAAQAQLTTARLARRDGTLLAPIGGLVAKRQALPGEKLAVEQPVLTLVDLSVLELAGTVGTHEVSRLAPGQAVRVRVEGIDAPVEGRIDRIAPAAEPGTRAIGVTVVIPNRGETLRAGQFALASLTLPDATPRLTVPLAAVSGPDGQSQVWAIEGGALVRRSVTLGRRSEAQARVEVLTGVSAESQLLAARFDGLKEGRQAKVVERAASVASAAASSPLR